MKNNMDSKTTNAKATQKRNDFPSKTNPNKVSTSAGVKSCNNESNSSSNYGSSGSDIMSSSKYGSGSGSGSNESQSGAYANSKSNKNKNNGPSASNSKGSYTRESDKYNLDSIDSKYDSRKDS